jgi:hypothetical protein
VWHSVYLTNSSLAPPGFSGRNFTTKNFYASSLLAFLTSCSAINCLISSGSAAAGALDGPLALGFWAGDVASQPAAERPPMLSAMLAMRRVQHDMRLMLARSAAIVAFREGHSLATHIRSYAVHAIVTVCDKRFGQQEIRLHSERPHVLTYFL